MTNATDSNRIAHLLMRFSEPAFLAGQDGLIVGANGSFCDLFNIRAGQLGKMRCWEIVRGVHRSGAPLCSPSCPLATQVLGPGGVPVDREVSIKTGHGRVGASMSLRAVGTGGSDDLVLHTITLRSRLGLETRSKVAAKPMGGGKNNSAFVTGAGLPMRMLDFLFFHSALEDLMVDRLVGIEGALQEISTACAPDCAVADLAAAAAQESHKHLRWLQDLFLLVRTEEGLEQPVSDRFSLTEAVMAAASEHLHGMKYSVKMLAAPTVECDPLHIQRILGNLLGNVAEHGHPPVEITVACPDGWATVEVADSGPGIPLVAVQTIWNPTDIKGSITMGLPLARRLALANHGDLRLLDPARARFCLRLPEAMAAGGGRESPAPKAADKRPPPPAPG